MKIFDNKGMLIIPNPMRGKFTEKTKLLVVNQLFCPNGHNLINQESLLMATRYFNKSSSG